MHGCFSSCWSLRGSNRSEWSAITTQPDRCGNEYRGEYQPDPESSRAQISVRGQLRAVDGVRVERKSFRRKPDQAIFQHGAEMRSAERDLLKKTNREKWHYRTKKCRSPRPT